MRPKTQTNLLFAERIAIIVFFISLLVFLTSPSPIIVFDPTQKNINVVQRLGIIIIISITSLAIFLYLANRRLKIQQPVNWQIDDIDNAINSLKPIQNPILQFIFAYLPWVLIFVALIEIAELDSYYPPSLQFFMRASFNHYMGIAAVGVSLLVFQNLIKQVPQTLFTLWARNIISPGTGLEMKDLPPQVSGANTEQFYKEYIQQFFCLLNDPRQIFFGLLCGIAGSSWLLDGIPRWLLGIVSDTDNAAKIFPLKFILETFITFFIGYVVGLQVWRMIVIGLMIHKLGFKFDLALQRGHPDGCEGLAPLGNLCLWSALTLSPAGIYLSARVVFDEFGYYLDLLYFLLFVIIAIASVSFFAPIWNVHKIMITKRETIRRHLDQLGQDINRLSWDLLHQGHGMDPVESEKIAKKLERLNQIYKDNQAIPVWPFNTRILARFVTSQIVPLLSLVGLGQPIVEITSNLMSFLTGLSGN